MREATAAVSVIACDLAMNLKSRFCNRGDDTWVFVLFCCEIDCRVGCYENFGLVVARAVVGVAIVEVLYCNPYFLKKLNHYITES